MGKTLESMGLIEGYNIKPLKKNMANKDELFEEIEKYDIEVKEQARKILNDPLGGECWIIIKKDKIKGIYLFELEIKNDKNNLKHIKTVYTDELTEEICKKYEEIMLNVVKEYVSMKDYDKAIFEDNVIQTNTKLEKKEKVKDYIIGCLFGILFGWIFFDEIIIGLILGIIVWGPIFLEIDVVVTKKRKKKQKNND